ncbi:MAG: multicopper oxidase family protein [Rhizobiales bacterium]|nr:multicopper oxidase family protein [Hyphomicrobiales bacterium]NRB15779.1 multicopper oxidase family protein [Hyphomicrobiales bacterium]
MSKTKISRRNLLKASLATMAAVSLPKLVLAMAEENVFYLTAKKSSLLFFNGAAASELWTYNGVLSGPEIRVKQGAEITVIFENQLDEATSIHWHGIRIDNKMDGVSGLTQEAVPPGEKFTYKFVAPDAGTFWYHAHNMSWSHVARGLYGALIIDEKTPLFDPDHDITIIVDDWRLDAQGRLDVDSIGGVKEWAHSGRLGNIITVNGELRPNILLNQNETYRLRVINVANSRIIAFDINQLGAEIIAYDGQTLGSPRKTNHSPLFLGPAQRVDLMLTPKSTQNIPLSNLGDAEPYNIANFVIQENSAPIKPTPRLTRNILPIPDFTQAEFHKIIIQGGAMSRMGAPIYKGKKLTIIESMESQQIWALNGIANLDDKPMFDLKQGKTIVIDFKNDTSFRHAMHIHGHHFKIISGNGVTYDEQLWKDTFLINPNSTIQIAFVADNLGKWLLHCHMLEHAAGGMNTWFRIT